MRIPRKLIIKGETWSVVRRDKLTFEGETVYGLCDGEKKVIYLRKNHNEEMLQWTFLHEFIHAVLFELHVDITEDITEVIADGVSKCFIDCFKISRKD